MTLQSTDFHKKAINIHNYCGFTLPEIMTVITIVAILYMTSLTVIRTVSHSAHKTAARAELKSIATAFRQYYSHYGNWPITDQTRVIDNALAEILSGTETSESKSNPDKLVFIEFARPWKDGIPLNPWAERFYKTDLEACKYYVACDIDGDNIISFTPEHSTNITVRSGIAVWTYDPEVSSTDNNYLIGSWQ